MGSRRTIICDAPISVGILISCPAPERAPFCRLLTREDHAGPMYASNESGEELVVLEREGLGRLRSLQHHLADTNGNH